jgi:branched-chain amino acid transport system substrate-binding protein
MVNVLIVVLLGSALLLSGEAGAGTLTQRSLLLCGGALALATDAPMSGIEGPAEGKPVANAVNLAVRQHQNLGGGYTLKTINYDDASPQTGIHDPSTGTENVQRVVHNPCILGMVGPLHSNVAPFEMPIAANAGLVMLSPATNPALTLRPYAEAQGLNFDAVHPLGKPITYFRLIPNDATQVVADADLIFDLGAKSAYVVNNPSPYGEMLAGGFTPAFEGKGGRVVGINSIGLDSAVIPDVATTIVVAKPDAVFYGGLTSSGGGLLKAQLVKLGYRGYCVGGDGIAK